MTAHHGCIHHIIIEASGTKYVAKRRSYFNAFSLSSLPSFSAARTHNIKLLPTLYTIPQLGSIVRSSSSLSQIVIVFRMDFEDMIHQLHYKLHNIHYSS